MKKVNLILTVVTIIFLLQNFSFAQSNSISGTKKDGIIEQKLCALFSINQYYPSLLFLNKTKSTGNNEGDIQKSDWYSKKVQEVSKEEYNISYNDENQTFESPNRKSNIRFIYNRDGFVAKTRQTKIPLFDMNDNNIKEEDKKYHIVKEWRIKLNVKGMKKGNDKFLIYNGGEISSFGNKANNEDENLRVDYINDENGMRQNFTAKNKPDGNGFLKVCLSVNTKLKIFVGSDILSFKNENGKEVMQYKEIKCWDANGKTLRGWFELINNRESKIEDNEEISIVVNDEDATYPITIDPLSTTANWIVNGTQSGENFGFCVSTAGDINGDGYSDVLVGAPNYDNGETDEGKAFLFNGSQNGISTSPSWTYESNQASSLFGQSVSTAGDVNGDGFSDIIVGAIYFDNGQTDEGRAFVFYGSQNGLPSSPDWTAENNLAGALFGHSVSTAGDVNGDGYSDVIIGAPFSFPNSNAYLYFGSSNGLSTVANWTGTGSGFYGFTVSTAGDVNGDGLSDVIVGVRDNNSAYLYLGAPLGPSTTAAWVVHGDNTGKFGYSVSTAGDVNGDGYSDILIGAPHYPSGPFSPGKCYLYYGSSTLPSTTPAWTHDGLAGGEFGESVSTAGDVNGDSYSDIIVGSHYINISDIFFGSSNGLPSSPSSTLTQSSGQFGWSVATAGDVNGDGYSDVIIGAVEDTGYVCAYFGGSDGPTNFPVWTQSGTQSGENFGFCVSTAGDINGDGYSDVLVGAPNYDNGETDEGKAFLFNGSQNGISTSPSWTYESNQASSLFGQSVSTAGDVNGDGFSDIIVGAIYFDNGQTDEGRAFVFYGSQNGLPSSPDWTAENNLAGALFGHSVSTAGDVNGDGYSDVIIGAPFSFPNSNAYLYFGSSNGLSTVANWTGTGSGFYGFTVSTAGDVNGDGLSDVIVGVRDNNSAYLYLGAPLGPSTTAAWVVHGDNTGKFGYSVSTAGDVNGDGYSDILIGAPHYPSGPFSPGKCYLYYGSSTLPSTTPAWTHDGLAGGEFGESVSTAGDVNGDSYSDIIVGSHYINISDIFFGSSNGLPSSPSSTLTQSSGQFGWSVATAGDVNGDGFSDVIIGAVEDVGYANVYYGNSKGGLKSIVQQYEPNTLNIISSQGFTRVNGQVRLSIFGRSPFGRADGKVIYEYKGNGLPFSSNPVFSSGSGSVVNLGINGTQLNIDVSEIPLTSKEYKWRARVQYSLIKNPYQKFGPWRYFSIYSPIPIGGFKPQIFITTYNIKAAIEGYYNNFANKLSKKDTVRAYLRNTSSPFDVVDSAKAVIDSVTLTGSFVFINAPSGNYYIQLKHRNGLETWSKSGGETFTQGGTLSYDFTSSASQAYGNNLIQKGSKYCIYSGDVNQDGIVDLTDLASIDIDASVFAMGYLPTDLDGNNIVDLSDMAYADNNAYNFVSARNPIVGLRPGNENQKDKKKLSKENDAPKKFELKDNYPNPFNPTTKINYELPNTSLVSLKVFDITGREVASLVNEKQNAGRYSVEFNGSSLSSGTYFYKIVAGSYIQVKKMILVK